MFSSAASRMVIVFLWFLCVFTFNLGMSHETNVTNILCNRKDQHMLSVFKQSITDPSNWLSSWTMEEDCCNWEGVECNNITGRVTELHLSCFWSESPSKCLGGEIKFSIFHLEFLTLLDLSFNDFETIHFGSHKYPLGVSSPTNFSNLLLHLDLSYNENLRMENLGWLPLFTSLEELSLSKTYFDSEMPKWLFNLSSGISILDLSFSNLRGQIPEALLKFQHLELLFLNSNNLSGSIPEWMGQFKHLWTLDLSNNSLSGPIPASIGNLSSLGCLDVGRNRLNGSLPTTLGQLHNLELLSIGYTSLFGKLSEQNFTNLSNLNVLRLESSSFTFHFATNWQPPFQLEDIMISNCKLGPEFPPWLYTQRFLRFLDLSSSGLSFNVEEKFWSFVSQIQDLILSNNSISGDISTKLITNNLFELRSNNFTGRLPHLSPQVLSFNIGNNRFSGPIYPMLCQNIIGNNSLIVLDMSHNLLSGEFPDCWWHWQTLIHVNLESNYLSGKIPNSMGLLVKLETLRLRHNSLSGHIPSSLKRCENLWFIDLAFNEFTGNIPSWIKPFNMALILRSNKFNGNVPLHICQLSNLLVLDLANNKLSGPIPKCLGNITTMCTNTLNKALFSRLNYRYAIIALPADLPLHVKSLDLDYWNSLEYVRIIDFSMNNLSGFIPQELFRLIALQSLNLSHNQLMGKIPSNIGQMEFLESIDLAGNHLSGGIPQSMTNLSFLNHLNLSYNNFDGRIPLGTQLQSFEASSYVGNPRLCGLPLPKNCAQEKKPSDLIKVSKNGDFKSSFKIGAGVGFSSAFCGIFGTLLFIKEWRHAYFRALESLYVFIVVKINRFQYQGH